MKCFVYWFCYHWWPLATRWNWPVAVDDDGCRNKGTNSHFWTGNLSNKKRRRLIIVWMNRFHLATQLKIEFRSSQFDYNISTTFSTGSGTISSLTLINHNECDNKMTDKWRINSPSSIEHSIHSQTVYTTAPIHIHIAWGEEYRSCCCYQHCNCRWFRCRNGEK